MRRTGGILRLVLKERYKSPTLELAVPAMLVGNVFVPAYLERGGFQLYGLVLAFVPLINVSETTAFALALRNVVFVTAEYIYQGYVASFLTMPITRRRFFAYTYFADVLVPLGIFLAVETFYLLISGLLNDYTISLLIIFSGGYLFSSSFVLLLSLILRSPGASVLAAGFSLGAVFIGGGIAEYYLILTNRLHDVALVSWMNPYVVAIAETIVGGERSVQLATYLTLGVGLDFLMASAFSALSYWLFSREDL